MAIPLIKKSFIQLLNQKVKIIFDENNKCEAELIEVKDLDSGLKNQRESFSLLFKMRPDQNIYSQRIYTIQTKSEHKFELFLVPIAPDKNGVYYEAVIN